MAKRDSHSQGKTGAIRALFRLARPFQNRLILIAVLALLATAADLTQPLIYRVAINDVAGLFVGKPTEPVAEPADAENHFSELPSAPLKGSPSTPSKAGKKTTGTKKGESPRAPKTRQQHRPGFVAPRTNQEALSTLLWAVAALFVVGVIGHYLTLASEYQSVVVANRIEAGLIQSTFGHVLRLPLSFFSRRASGGLGKRIDQSDQVAPIVSAFSQQIAPEVIRIIGICAIMLTQSRRLTTAALAVLPLYFLIARHAARRLESGMAEYYARWENVSARIQDALASIKTVKLSGAESREVKRLQDSSQEAYSDYLNRAKLGNRYLLLQSMLNHLSKALVLGYGGWLVLDRQLTPGDVVMFVAYLDRLYDPIDSLSSIAVSLQQNLASLNRAIRLLMTGPEEPQGAPLATGPGKVEFREVRFGYAANRDVLSGLSFTAEPGKTTALIGPSGAGKTTAVDLLLKLWEPKSGGIFIDNQPLSGADPSAVRRAVGVVAADGAIFRGTLADNIRYKRPDATDAEVESAAMAAGLRNTLERLPDGLKTGVGEHGIGLSVGERQRLQIARILVDRPLVLVLDEATANLDYATENEVKRTLGHLSYRPTTLVIAHRYSMVKDADHVIVLDEGKIREQGAPDQLIAAGGWFSRFAVQAAQAAPAGN
jgi:ABC-type multidrug transport system fused ATPase/permease subunit